MARPIGYLLLLLCLRLCYGYFEKPIPDSDKQHYNPIVWPDRSVEGTAFMVPEPQYSPDYRVLVPFLGPYKPKMKYKEHHRPYRISPVYHQIQKWQSIGFYENLENLGGYCCTVFKKRIPLAGCAIVTTRHLLTTATSTELVLGANKHHPTMEGLLGAWYDILDKDPNHANSSMYMTPARIHYHPGYMRPHDVNISHPLPVIKDLAIWAATFRFHQDVYVVRRPSASDFLVSPTPKFSELVFIVGFQWIQSWNRRPSAFHKYFFRMRFSHYDPCTKQDWGWFHCMRGHWFRLGVESGAALHITRDDITRKDGLIGLGAFSMRLRTKQVVHYFTVVDTHSNLEFYYDAYMGRLPYEFLDARFEDTKKRSPVPKAEYNIEISYPLGVNRFTVAQVPFY